ncbi:glutathione S-transferase family protein [Zavarzinia sp.]|uniref:glutathione S-transferase family protein n=1 Tax=Zavarzinia sp. TaxID=2027920 RepID=UPI0035642BC1
MVQDSRPVLVIGDKNYSSWSMRPWLAMTAGGIDFIEAHVKLRTEATKADILRHSPSGKVPALKLGDVVIPESLAICEWAAEESRTGPLLPVDSVARALCRAAAAEMHSGFGALRNECPMDILARRSNHPISDACRSDISRIEGLWVDCRARFGQNGPYLFGHWTIADAMYAPVVSRFITYGVHLLAEAADYVATASHHHAYQAWEAGARAERGL